MGIAAVLGVGEQGGRGHGDFGEHKMGGFSTHIVLLFLVDVVGDGEARSDVL